MEEEREGRGPGDGGVAKAPGDAGVPDGHGPGGAGAGEAKGVSPRSWRKSARLTLIALVLLVTCAAILTATRAYGVWVISGIALVLFALGLLRKEKPPEGSGPDPGGEDGRLRP